jgi:hypothetical protein
MALGLRAENPSRAASSVGQSRPAGGWRRRWLVAECVTAILAVSVACASASPPNPSWIAGLYDDDDYDDVLRMVADGAGVSGSRASQRVECVVVGLVLGAATGQMSRPATHRQAIRPADREAGCLCRSPADICPKASSADEHASRFYFRLVCRGGLVLIHDARFAGGEVPQALDRIERAGFGVVRLRTTAGGMCEDKTSDLR